MPSPAQNTTDTEHSTPGPAARTKLLIFLVLAGLTALPSLSSYSSP
ncbi:hypothetical protein [Streptomyces sp. cg35]